MIDSQSRYNPSPAFAFAGSGTAPPRKTCMAKRCQVPRPTLGGKGKDALWRCAGCVQIRKDRAAQEVTA